MGIGGKFQLIKNTLAYSDLWGAYLNLNPNNQNIITMIQYSPSLNSTFYSSEHLEFNLSCSVPIEIFISEEFSGLFIGTFIFNLCPAFSTDFAEYSIRPLLGMSTLVVSEQVWFFGGLGISYNF